MSSKVQLQKDLISVLEEEIGMIKAGHSQKIASKKIRPLMKALVYLKLLANHQKVDVETVKLTILSLSLARRHERAIMEYIRRAYESDNDRERSK